MNNHNDLLNDHLGELGDDFYEALMSAHTGLSEPQSHALNARLVLLFANSIGDLDTLQQLLDVATQNQD
ncbi:MAG: DUF2783 domain-containing protein [Gammaproteobacteria bacterium]|nr:DUF2783 domain-containing protein [Gammaproteobacteria bacterium]